MVPLYYHEDYCGPRWSYGCNHKFLFMKCDILSGGRGQRFCEPGFGHIYPSKSPRHRPGRRFSENTGEERTEKAKEALKKYALWFRTRVSRDILDVRRNMAYILVPLFLLLF